MTAIEPFWHRLPEFFRYPRHTACMLHIAVATLLFFISFEIGLFGLVPFLAGLFIILRYAYSVLQHTADGHESPPDNVSSSSPVGLILKQLSAILTGSLFVGYVAHQLGPIASIFAVMLFELWLPASVMIIAVSHSVVNAINPLFFINFMRRIGWPYLMLWAFLSLLSISSAQTFGLLSHVIPEAVNTIAYVFLACYFLIIMFNMLGYVIYQYHDELGYDVSQLALAEKGKRDSQVQTAPVFDDFDHEVNTCLFEGDYATAVDKILHKTRLNPNNHFQHERLINLLMSLDAPQQLSEALEKYILVLIDQGDQSKVVTWLALVSPSLPEFYFKSSKLAAGLIEVAWNAKNADAVIGLARNLRRLLPNSPHNLPAGIYEAKALCEFKHNDTAALARLDELDRAFAHDERVGDVAEYRRFIHELSGANV